MSFVAEQREEVMQTRTIQYISAALRDVSAVQLKQLLERYSENTSYYDSLQALCQMVWRIAEHEGVVAEKKTKGTLFVAYTTDRHFYGALNTDVMHACERQIGSADELLIIGATGRSYWRAEGRSNKRVRFQSFKGDIPTGEETVDFLRGVDRYAHVYVVYPRFVSVYEQSVAMIDITYRPTEVQASEQVVHFPEYVLEPDIRRVLEFFETQVRHLLFDRLLLETQLAQVSARLVRMDMADHNAQDMLKAAKCSFRRAQAMFMNTRLLETTSGYIQWKQTNT